MSLHASMYMTLPSNTSDFEDVNRTNSFRVRLPEPVQLLGAWEVALVDLQYPYSWRNLAGKQTVRIQYKTSIGSPAYLEGVVPSGYYGDVPTLLDGVRLAIRDAARNIPVMEALVKLVLHRTRIIKRFPAPPPHTALEETSGKRIKRNRFLKLAEVARQLSEDQPSNLKQQQQQQEEMETEEKGSEYMLFRQPLSTHYRQLASAEEVERDDALFEQWMDEKKRLDSSRVEDAAESELEHAFDGSLTRGMGRVKVRVAEGKSINALWLPQTVSYMLGLSETHLKPGRTYRASYQPDLTAGLTTLYVHCSIVEPQVVGNVRSELLRAIPIDSKHDFGDTVHELFTSPHYIGVLRRSFDHIKIEIRTDSGELVPFEHGKCVVKLHFRKAKGGI